MKFVSSNVEVFMSEIGSEFISAFSLHHSNQGPVETSSKIMTNLRKLLHI